MFERYTGKARRAVFFARYEASQYGNPYIETEHLLLGLWREDHALRGILKDTAADSQVRAEIERRIKRNAPIGTSLEVPLSADCKKILLFAAEEADRLGQRHVGTEHMLLGLLRVEGSLGAQVARARGLKAEELRERFAKEPRLATFRKPSLPILEDFLTGLKWHSAGELIPFFAENALVVDVHGKRWNYEEIAKNFEALFVPYSKKNASYTIEETLVNSNDHVVAIVLWKNALVASMERVCMHRMTVVLASHDDGWAIVSMHITPVQP
jgi:Clp amino terminal domain, pathogenicity island component/SnoaL-like domain